MIQPPMIDSSDFSRLSVSMKKITNNIFYDDLFKPEKMPTKCLLCDKGELDELGHIIPKLAMRWLKKAGRLKNFHFNNTESKVADTPAIRMMCKTCEDKLSIIEKSFTDDYFKKYYKKQPIKPATDELYVFAISVAWRLMASSRILKDTETHLDAYNKAFSHIEGRAKSILRNPNGKTDIAVYVFSSDEIINNIAEDKVNRELLLYSIRQGLKAHNLRDGSGFFTITHSRVPIIAFKIGFLYFFVVDTGYFRNVQFSMSAIRSPGFHNLYSVEFTSDFLGFMNWCFDFGLYEVDSSCIPKADYERRNI